MKVITLAAESDETNCARQDVQPNNHSDIPLMKSDTINIHFKILGMVYLYDMNYNYLHPVQGIDLSCTMLFLTECKRAKYPTCPRAASMAKWSNAPINHCVLPLLHVHDCSAHMTYTKISSGFRLVRCLHGYSSVQPNDLLVR